LLCQIPFESLVSNQDFVGALSFSWMEFCFQFSKTKAIVSNLEYENKNPNERALKILMILHQSKDITIQQFIEAINRTQGIKFLAKIFRQNWNLDF
jgi:hypothetical protein